MNRYGIITIIILILFQDLKINITIFLNQYHHFCFGRHGNHISTYQLADLYL